MNYISIQDPINHKFYHIKSERGNMILNKYLELLNNHQYIMKGGEVGNKKIYAPPKYFEGLTKEESKKRMKRMKEGVKSSHKDPNAYRDFETDFRNNKRIKTKPSRYTKQWRKYFPDAKSLESKSELTGVPIDIIQKVYNKGMAAWRTGHRPGANSQQWGYARVHSFLVKGKAFYTSDRKLALESIQKSEKAKKWFKFVEGLCDVDKDERDKWCNKACKLLDCKNN